MAGVPIINAQERAKELALLRDQFRDNPGIFRKMVSGLVDLPHKAYETGEMPDPGEAMGYALNMAGGGMAMPKPAGSLGIFGGIGAKHFPVDDFRRFQLLEGFANPRTNHELTGIHRGVTDNKVRFEINDLPAKVKGLDKWDDLQWAEGQLSDYLDHPELYKNYPELAHYPVSIRKGEYQGSMSNAKQHGRDLLYAQGRTPEQIRSIILHEITHGIQNREGFARGAAYSEAHDIKNIASAHTDVLAKERMKLINNIRTKRAAGQDFSAEDKRIQWIDNNLNQTRTVRDMEDYDVYRNVPGEKEASNVQMRADWNEGSRRRNYPPDTANEARTMKFW